MAKSVLAKAQDGTITLTITIPSGTVKKVWDEEVENLVKSAQLPGFRKGMAPRKLVEEKLDNFKLQEDVLRKLLPTAYAEAIKEHGIKPVMSPKIHVQKIENPSSGSGQLGNPPAGGWEFNAVTCEMPEISLGDYKKKVKDLTAKSKIEVPGKKEENPGPTMDQLIAALLSETKMTIPQVMLDSEIERLLAQLLDEVKSLGLSLDQYLSSTHKTIEEVKKDYATRAESDIKVEFALQKVADTEKIQVGPEELQDALSKAKDEKERKNLEANIYLLASILRQQKTLDYLKNL